MIFEYHNHREPIYLKVALVHLLKCSRTFSRNGGKMFPKWWQSGALQRDELNGGREMLFY